MASSSRGKGNSRSHGGRKLLHAAPKLPITDQEREQKSKPSKELNELILKASKLQGLTQEMISVLRQCTILLETSEASPQWLDASSWKKLRDMMTSQANKPTAMSALTEVIGTVVEKCKDEDVMLLVESIEALSSALLVLFEGSNTPKRQVAHLLSLLGSILAKVLEGRGEFRSGASLGDSEKRICNALHSFCRTFLESESATEDCVPDILLLIVNTSLIQPVFFQDNSFTILIDLVISWALDESISDSTLCSITEFLRSEKMISQWVSALPFSIALVKKLLADIEKASEDRDAAQLCRKGTIAKTVLNQIRSPLHKSPSFARTKNLAELLIKAYRSHIHEPELMSTFFEMSDIIGWSLKGESFFFCDAMDMILRAMVHMKGLHDNEMLLKGFRIASSFARIENSAKVVELLLRDETPLGYCLTLPDVLPYQVNLLCQLMASSSEEAVTSWLINKIFGKKTMTSERECLLYLKLLVSIYKTNETSYKTLPKYTGTIIEGLWHWESSLRNSARLKPCIWELISVSFLFVREFLVKSELTYKMYEEIKAITTSFMKRCTGHRRSTLLCSLFICYVTISKQCNGPCDHMVCTALLTIHHKLGGGKIYREFFLQLLHQANESQLQLIATDTLQYISKMYPLSSRDEYRKVSLCWRILQEILVIDLLQKTNVRERLIERFSYENSYMVGSKPIESFVNNPVFYDAKMWSFSSLSSSMASRLADEIRPSKALSEVREVFLDIDAPDGVKTECELRQQLEQVWRNNKPVRLINDVWAEMCTHFKFRTLFGGPTQTFEAMEHLLDKPHLNSPADFAELESLIFFIESLERQIAQHSSSLWRASTVQDFSSQGFQSFLQNNHEVFKDWFERIRSSILKASAKGNLTYSLLYHATRGSNDRTFIEEHPILESTIGQFALALIRENEVEYLIGFEKWLKEDCKNAFGFMLEPVIYQAKGQFEDAIDAYDKAGKIAGDEGRLFISQRLRECMAAMGVWDWWRGLSIEDESISDNIPPSKNSISTLRAYWNSYRNKFEYLEHSVDYSMDGSCFPICQGSQLQLSQFQISCHQFLSSPSRLGSLMWALSASGLSSHIPLMSLRQEGNTEKEAYEAKEGSVNPNNIAGYVSCLKAIHERAWNRDELSERYRSLINLLLERAFDESVAASNSKFARVILEEASPLGLDLPAWKVYIQEGHEDEAMEDIEELIKRRKERGYAHLVQMAKLKMQDSLSERNDKLHTLLVECSSFTDVDVGLKAEAFNCIGVYFYQMWKSRGALGKDIEPLEEMEKNIALNLLSYLQLEGCSSGYTAMKALHLLVRVLMERISKLSNKDLGIASGPNPDISSLEGIVATWSDFPLKISPETWAFVFPQLIAMSRITITCIKGLAKKILSHVVANIPDRAAFTLLVETNSRNEFRFHENGNEVLKSIADELPSQLREGLGTLITGLKKIAVLWEEERYSLIHEMEVEVKKRCENINARREAIDAGCVVSDDLKRAALEREYQSTMSPIIRLLKMHVQKSMDSEATELFDEERLSDSSADKAVLDSIRNAVERLESAPEDFTNLAVMWKPFQSILQQLKEKIRGEEKMKHNTSERSDSRQLNLVSHIPMLFDFFESGGGLPMPKKGYTSDGMVDDLDIVGIQKEGLVLPTKTRPKRISFLGSDGKSYDYLVKGREDLRLDARIMQLLDSVNAALRQSNSRGYLLMFAKSYAVTPLADRVGLIEWVPDLTSLNTLYRSWLEEEKLPGEGSDKFQSNTIGEGIRLKDSSITKETENFEGVPSLAKKFNAKLVERAQAIGYDLNSYQRATWPKSLLLSVFHSLRNETPNDLVIQLQWCGSSSTADWWKKHKNFIASSSVTSMVGYLIGLGDRHPDNVLFDRNSGAMVHIDFNVCFDKGVWLRVPELVPFRLTSTVRKALGISGVHGVFQVACGRVLKMCSKEQDMLLSILDTFRLDPLADWAVERVENAVKKYFDAYSGLAQFLTTVTVTEAKAVSLEEQFDNSFASFTELCKRVIEQIPLVLSSQSKARDTQIATEEALLQHSQESERELELLAVLSRGEEAQEVIRQLRESPRLLRDYFSSIRDSPSLVDVQKSKTESQKLSEAWQSRLELSRNLITLIEQFLSARNADFDLPDLISAECQKLQLADSVVSEQIHLHMDDAQGQAVASAGQEASLSVAGLLSIGNSVVMLVNLAPMAEELRAIREKKGIIQHVHADFNMQVHAAQTALSDLHASAILPLQQVFLILNQILAEDGNLPSMVESIVKGFKDLEVRIASLFPDESANLKILCQEGAAIIDTFRLILASCRKVMDMTSHFVHDYAQMRYGLSSEEKELESQLLNLPVVSKWRQNIISCVSKLWRVCESQVRILMSESRSSGVETLDSILIQESRLSTLQKAERAVRLVAGRLDSPAPTKELIARATDEENLSQMFEGWGAWI